MSHLSVVALRDSLFTATEISFLNAFTNKVADRPLRISDSDQKAKIHREGRAVLRVLAKGLALNADDYSVRSCIKGNNELGTITMQMRSGSIQILQSQVYRDLQIKVRRYGGPNNRLLVSSHTLPINCLKEADYLINRIKPILRLI